MIAKILVSDFIVHLCHKAIEFLKNNCQKIKKHNFLKKLLTKPGDCGIIFRRSIEYESMRV